MHSTSAIHRHHGANNLERMTMARSASFAGGSHAPRRSANLPYPDAGGADDRAWRGEVVPLVYLAFVLLLGGGGTYYPLVETAIEWAAIGVIGWSTLRLRHAAIGPFGKALLALAALALLLPLAQLIPLPWSVWSTLGGQEQAVAIYRILGWEGVSRPLSLSPDATRATLLAQLPALAALLAVLGLSWTARLVALRIVVAIALLGILVAALQIAAGPDAAPLLYDTAHRGYGVGLFVNRNHQAVFLLVAMLVSTVPGVLVPDRRGVGGIGRLPFPALLAIVALLAMGVLASASRTALLLLPLALAGALLPFVRRVRRGRWLPATIGVAMVAAVALWFTPLVQGVLARFATVGEEDRYNYWDNSLFALRQSLPWGTGFGSFQTVYPVVEPLDQIQFLTVPHAHSDYLELAMEGGVPALALALAGLVLVGCGLVAALRAGGADATTRRGVAIGATGGIVMLLAGSIVDFPLRMSALLTLFAALVALLAPPAVVPARRRSGIAWRIVVAVVLLGAAWQALAQGLSQQLMHGRQGAAASQVAPWSGRAWAMVAAQHPLPGQAAAAEAAARRALATRPMDAVAVRVAGLAAIARGDTATGQTLLRQAAQLGWRDAPTQLWLVREAINAGAFDFALERIDALLRQRQLAPILYAQMSRLFDLPEGRSAIARRLAERPGWRQGFLNTLARGAPDRVDALAAFYGDLARAGVPVRTDEVRLTLWRLAEAGDMVAAERLWRMAGGTGRIGNGGFDGPAGALPPAAPPFDWRAPPAAGVRVAIGEPDQPWNGQAVEIAADAGSAGTPLAQRTRLLPGTYRLGFVLRSDGPVPALDWIVACGDAPPVTATLAAPVADRGWQRYAGTIRLPGRCDDGELRVRLGETNRAVSAWIDDVTLARTG
ncbi:hypothetical protein ASE78_04760 [Sphingomonas sp. Leaf25]|nr:hypothetical protein ASE78_04760 [Sphingomonas sp. Leaf25]